MRQGCWGGHPRQGMGGMVCFVSSAQGAVTLCTYRLAVAVVCKREHLSAAMLPFPETLTSALRSLPRLPETPSGMSPWASVLFPTWTVFPTSPPHDQDTPFFEIQVEFFGLPSTVRRVFLRLREPSVVCFWGA